MSAPPPGGLRTVTYRGQQRLSGLVFNLLPQLGRRRRVAKERVECN